MKKYLILLSLLAACTRPIPCPPLCFPLPTPTPTTATPTATPTPPPSSATPTPRPEPSPPPVEVRQLTSGRTVFEIDLAAFTVPPPVPNPKAGQPGEPNELQLDSFAFATLAWTPPGSGPDRYPTTPALQLGLRGVEASPCLVKPCAGKVALEVRYSANVRYDRTLTDEKAMCGAGTRPPQWIPLGPGPKVRVTLEWGPGFVRASTPAGSWQTAQGAAGPGFGWWTPGIPPKGLGWAYKDDWTLQAHGGSAQLLGWEAVGEQPPLGACP